MKGIWRSPLTRRHFIWAASAATGGSSGKSRLLVPVHRVMDSRARCTPEQMHYFWSTVWPEAVRNFSGGGIGLRNHRRPRRGAAISRRLADLRRAAQRRHQSGSDRPYSYEVGQRPRAGRGHHDSRRLSCLPDRAALCAWQPGAFHLGQHLRARAVACTASGRLRKTPELVPDRQPGSANRLVCYLALAVPRGRGDSKIGPGLSRPLAIERGRASATGGGSEGITRTEIAPSHSRSGNDLRNL